MDAIQATIARFQSLADGTLRLIVDVHQPDTEAAMQHFARVGQSVALALLDHPKPEPVPQQSIRSVTE